jgi:hypothetical protein
MARDQREPTDHREVMAFGSGAVVVIDGVWREDGLLRVVLDQFTADQSGDATCQSEDELREALIRLGAFEEQAATTAALLWARHMGRGASRS